MALTPSQTNHLAAIVELSNRHGGGVPHDELHHAVWDAKRGTAPAVTRAVNALEASGYITVHAASGGGDEYHPTDKGREALAQAGAAGNPHEEA